MGTKVQSKTYFPGSMTDLNNGFCNGVWDLFHDDKNRKISGPGNGQHYDYFLMKEAMDGYAKEQIKQTILKQESIFRHQIQELHRLYKRQRDLMNPMPEETHIFVSRFNQPSTSRTNSFFSPLDSKNGKSIFISKCDDSERRVIDLEQPADIYETNKGSLTTKNTFNLADLNEPVPVEETDFSAKRTIFGVELCEKNQNPSFNCLRTPVFHPLNSHSGPVLPWQKTISGHMIVSDLGFPNLKTATSNNLEERNILDVEKNQATLMPPWLTTKNPCEQIKAKQTTLYQMNLDSLQNHSQQFFKKVEVEEGHESQESKKVKPDDFVSETKILGENGGKKLQIDLNLSFNEEDDPSTSVLEFEAEFQETLLVDDLEGTCVEIVEGAAEAIMLISKSGDFAESRLPPGEPPAATLQWFAEVVTSPEDDGYAPEGMDDFEYMTLKLQDIKEDYFYYKPMVLEEKEDESILLSKRTARKGQGRRGQKRKDFQKDVLPSIVSLCRREVTEDLQIFEEALNATGISWQSSLSKRKAAARNGRARRRLMAAGTAVERTACREVALEEKSLGGWGRRTRRLPRQRCASSGSHHSLALKC